MEVLVSDGIAGMTFPVPLVRVSVSEILMPLLLSAWQTQLVIHLKMFLLQEEVFVAPSPHPSKAAILEIRMQLWGESENMWKNLL